MTAEPALENVWRTVKLFNSFDINFHRTGFHNFYVVIQRVCKKLVQFHWLHFFTFLLCAFSNVSSNRLPERMQSHIGCICLTFLRCGFSNVSSNRLPQRMHNHTGCICLSFLHCTMSPLSTRNCFKSSKVRPISNCWFCHLIYKKICLNVLESKQRREKLVFVIL